MENMDYPISYQIEKRCPWCDEKSYYNTKHDAIFCKACDRWLEEKCLGCEFCTNRPDKPSQAEE